MVPLKLTDLFGAKLEDIHDLEEGMDVLAFAVEESLSENDVVKLNVGGKIFHTTKTVKVESFMASNKSFSDAANGWN